MSPGKIGRDQPVILLIADNPITRTSVRSALAGSGYSLLEAPSGEAALDLVGREMPDVMVVDSSLVDMDAPELLLRVRGLPGGEEIPVLVLLGLLSREEANRSLRAGFSDYVLKPIQPPHLLKVLGDQIGRSGSGAASDSVSGAGRRILVADDDPVQLKLSRLRLADAGFEVHTASDGVEALREARKIVPEAILSDVLMPGLDGFRLCLVVRSDPVLARIPVVLASSVFIEEGDRKLAEEVGANSLVTRTGDHRAIVEALLASLETTAAPTAAPPSEIQDGHYADRVMGQLERQVRLSAQLMEDLALREIEVAILSATAGTLSADGSPDEVLERLLQSALDAVGMSHGALYRLPASGRPKLECQSGFGEGSRSDLEEFFGRFEILHAVGEGGAPTLLTGRAGETEGAAGLLEAAGLKSILLLPIGTRFGGSGVLWLGSVDRILDGDWIRFGQSLAIQLNQSLTLSDAFSRATRAESMYREIFLNSTEGLLRISANGELIAANPALARILGHANTGDLVVSAPSLEQIFGNETQSRRFMERMQAELVVVGFELEAMLRGDRAAWLLANGRAVRDGAGAVRFFECSVQDVTQRREAERLTALVEARKAELALKDQLLSHVSHELRSPLAAIHQFVTLLLDGLAGDIEPKQREYLDIALRNANQLAGMIRDLLEVTRAQAGKFSIVPRRTRIDPVLRHCVASILPAAEAKRVAASCTFEGDLPEVVIDPSRTHQTLTNLLENALKFTPPGGRIQVRAVTSAGDPEFVLVSVEDTGCGIDPGEQNRVFENLYQVPGSVEEGRKGLGIGLYLCKEWIERQGGKIWVDSRPGSGSRFTFTIPIFRTGTLIGPICTPGNLAKGAFAILAVTVSPLSQRQTNAEDEPALAAAWDALAGCILPHSDVALPRSGPCAEGETFYVVCSADPQGIEALSRRIESFVSPSEDLRAAGLGLQVRATALEFDPSEHSLSAKTIAAKVSEILDAKTSCVPLHEPTT